MLKQKFQVVSVDTPVGDFSMVVANNIVVTSGFCDYQQLILKLPGRKNQPFKKVKNHRYASLVKQYFAGELDALNRIKYYQASSEFYSNVYKAMVGVGPGQTVSYKTLAKNSGYPKAIRATASACKRNLIPLIVPCHRIVRSDGGIGKYLYGSDIKKWLLNHEGVK